MFVDYQKILHITLAIDGQTNDQVRPDVLAQHAWLFPRNRTPQRTMPMHMQVLYDSLDGTQSLNLFINNWFNVTTVEYQYSIWSGQFAGRYSCMTLQVRPKKRGQGEAGQNEAERQTRLSTF